MKKLLFVVVLALVSTAVFSQVKFGVKVGPNFANGSGDDFTDTDSRTSMAIGAFTKISLLEKFAFQPEIQYSMQGAKYSESGLDETLKLEYINIPLIFKYYIISGLNLNVGPQVGYLAAAKMKADYEGQTEEIDYKDYCKEMDLGFDFGVGFDLLDKLCLDFRYNLGMSNIQDDDKADGANRVLQFTVGYIF